MPDKKLPRLTLRQFRSFAADGGGSAVVTGILGGAKLVRDVAGVEPVAENTTAPLSFVISTKDVDRYNTRIYPEGCRNLEEFDKSGVVLWAHESWSPPIAKPLGTRVDGERLLGDALFAPADMDHPFGRGFGQLVRRMYAEGFMRAVSIGFIPIKVQEQPERGEWGFDITEWELAEWSCVPVPGNPKALHDAQTRGIDIVPFYRWAESLMDAPARAGIDRDMLEDAYLQLRAFAPPRRAQQLSLLERARPVGVPARQARMAITWAAAHPEGTPAANTEEEWDGAAEVTSASVADLDVMCAWRAEIEAGKDPTKADYKLPHHKAEGEHAVVWAGLTAAMGSLLGARDGVEIPDAERQAVYDHLARHYRDDFKAEAPEFRAVRPVVEGDGQRIGRVLSRDNEAMIQELRAHAEQMLKLCDSLLAQLEPAEEPPEEPEAPVPMAAEPELRDAEFEIEDLAEIATLVRQQVRAAIEQQDRRYVTGEV